jgi:NAD+ diphosphatase
MTLPCAAWCCAFHADAILLCADFSLPLCATVAREEYYTCHEIGVWQGAPVFALDLCHATAPAGLCFVSMRDYMRVASAAQFTHATRAFQLLQWRRNHLFCGRCGSRTQIERGEHCLRCPTCDLRHYPRLSPVVIMSIVRGDSVLLSRSPHFRLGMYSVQAGFVEVGETLEQAVVREVAEETTLEITALRYFGSQSWPFPHSLMVGFTCEYAGGTVCIDGRELEDARWCRADQLPAILPPPLSIARQLIESFRNSV